MSVSSGASYARRYEVLCQRLVLERKYTAACLTLASSTQPTEISFPSKSVRFRQFAAAVDGYARAFVNARA